MLYKIGRGTHLICTSIAESSPVSHTARNPTHPLMVQAHDAKSVCVHYLLELVRIVNSWHGDESGSFSFSLLEVSFTFWLLHFLLEYAWTDALLSSPRLSLEEAQDGSGGTSHEAMQAVAEKLGGAGENVQPLEDSASSLFCSQPLRALANFNMNLSTMLSPKAFFFSSSDVPPEVSASVPSSPQPSPRSHVSKD